MKNFERHEAIEELLAKHTARELAGMVVDKSSRYESLMKHGMICDECGGQGFLGNPPDDFYDCPKCIASTNKIKAEAIREAAEALYYSDLSCGRQSESEYEVNYFRAYANKLENKK